MGLMLSSPPPRAHWYLAVICFPGLKGPIIEKNPLCPGPFPEAPPSDEQIPDHCRPLSPDRDGLDSCSEDPSPGGPEATEEGRVNGEASFTEGGQEPSGAPTGTGSVQPEAEQHFTSEFLNLKMVPVLLKL